MPTVQHRCTQEEIERIGEEIYRRDIRPKVMPRHKGKFLVLDIETGDYELDADDLAPEKRLRARRPEGVFHVIRVGFKTPYTLGGSSGLDEEK